MRKGIAECKSNDHYRVDVLKNLEDKGYKYVQIKGLTMDKHYDYIEPHTMVLVPLKELPTDPAQKDIYEPIESDLLKQWASESSEHFQIMIANVA